MMGNLRKKLAKDTRAALESITCPFCGAKMTRDENLTATYKDQTFTGIKGYSCTSCDNEAYDAGEVSRMEDMYHGGR